MMKWIASLLLAFLVALPAAARVVFNEVQASNDATILDEDGASSDWLELYNDGDAAVSLGGWGLSDKAKKPFKWVFPETARIAPKDHLLVFASGKDRTNIVLQAELAPNEVKGLCLWLRGDDAAKLTYNGGRVATWYDQSGKGNNATQTTRTYRPTVVTNAVNGHAALKFTHANSQMLYLPTNFNGMASLDNASVYVVCRWSGTTTSVGLFGHWRSGDSSQNCHFEVQSGGLLRWRVGSVDLKVSRALEQDVWTSVSSFTEMARETPLVSLYKDGERLASSEKSIGKSSFTQANGFYIGNSCDLAGGSSQRGYDGLIAEVALFDHALTAEERRGIDQYFAHKYLMPKYTSYHTNFSLGGEGETLTLTAPDGTVADTVTFTQVPCDTSWGRATDGADAFGWFASPTPGAANAGTVYAAPLAPVTFTPPRGVYTAAQAVTLSHADPEAAIYYTLDHSEPSAANGTRYTGTPIAVTKSAFIRATAVKAGHVPYRNIMTHSYLYLNDATNNPGIPSGFPKTWKTAEGSSAAVYGVSSNIVKTAQEKAALVAALKAAPILSIVLPDEDLFGSTDGVYTHPTEAGLEAAASCEWIATNGLGRVQIDAGLRAQGAASRQFGKQPKKSFRLCFRGRYGSGSLAEPVLDAAGCDLADFDTLVLRAEYNNSWTHGDATQRTRGSFVRDQFLRDIFRDMGQPGAYGTQVHLFLNGYYWGYYNLAERPDAAYGETYFGGRKDQWDVLKSGAEVRDGDNVAWNEMYKYATTGTVSTAAGYAYVSNRLDVVNFADYMLINHWGGNQDWPGNNWVTMRLKGEGERFRFCAWDAERTLEYTGDNRLGATAAHPGLLHSKLLASTAYKSLYQRRARRHLHPRHGLLAATNTVPRWEAMCAAVEPSVFAEAARWGNYRREAGNTSTTYGLGTWQTERVRVRDTYLPTRPDSFKTHLKSAGLWVEYPTVEEYVFLQADKGNWDNDDNWSTDVYPDLPGARARIGVPAADGLDAKGVRNVRLKDHAVVVGTLSFENGAFINRVCNKDAVVAGADYGVLFDSGTREAAVLAVRDTSGGGSTVFDNAYPTRFVNDLRVIVDNPEGSLEYGALRLQQTWEGAGAFIKEGIGRCSLTGAGKNWTGGTRVRAGLLSATAKAFPLGTVTLEPGGSFLVVGAEADEISTWRARFDLDASALADPRTLHLWVRVASEGLYFSARVASPGTALIFR